MAAFRSFLFLALFHNVLCSTTNNDDPHAKTAAGVGGISGGILGAIAQKVLFGEVTGPMTIVNAVVGATAATVVEVQNPSKSSSDAVRKSTVVGGAGGVGSTAAYAFGKGPLPRAIKSGQKYSKKTVEWIAQQAAQSSGDGNYKSVAYAGIGPMFTQVMDRLFPHSTDGKSSDDAVTTDSTADDQDIDEDRFWEGEFVDFVLRNSEDSYSTLDYMYAAPGENKVKLVTLFKAKRLKNDSAEDIKIALVKFVNYLKSKK